MRMKTKLFTLLVATILTLTGCKTTQNESSAITCYADDNPIIEIGDFKFRFDISINSYSKNVYIPFYVTSSKLELTKLEFRNGYIYRESNGAKYNLFSYDVMFLENDIERHHSYSTEIPTSLKDENYQFIFEVLGKTIKMNLYYNPDNFLNVYYRVNGNIIKTEKVHKGEYASFDCVYENPNHLQYAGQWRGEFKTIDIHTPITEDTYLVPVMTDAVSYLTTSSDVYSYVYLVKYVFSDKVCVLDESYKNKPIGLLYGWNNSLGITDLYLPRSLVSVSARCFANVTNLKIHYPGSQETWNQKINYTGDFGLGTKMIFNSSFSF